MKILRDYQIANAKKGIEILQERHLVYLQCEVRTGKTLMALEIAKIGGYGNVLFATKKKAISSIQKDYDDFGYKFDITIINDESLHTVVGDFDLVIHDEHHRFGSFPKPGIATKKFKERFSHLPMIFLSGTPHPESYSQVYHQFWISNFSPFAEFKNFYKWFAGLEFVKTEFDLGYGMVANYSNNEDTIYKFYSIQLRKLNKKDPKYTDKQIEIKVNQTKSIAAMHKANAKLMRIIDPYLIKQTQAEAGFTSSVNEKVIYCKMQDITYKLINKLKKDKVVRGKDEVILGDTAVKCMGKVHQLSSGTIKFESGNSAIIDDSKARFIRDKFTSYKIGIFYKFQSELDMLKQVYGDKLCTDLDTFNATDKNIALQIVSGREGISLSKADYLVYINIDFSSLSYWHSRDRLTTMDRKNNDIFWVFAEGGIEDYVYNAVIKKKDYTSSVFKKDFLS
ncbi:hypothetical protein DBR40_05440 [Pedobacter sp. KBW01]|uniref:SNF2-related protein n=1 Tax=Pedobacter sp. KBW01 TaxID=2153364 RepID=UPI000F5AA08C|nr:SNF2-related protein [Pedobacter sp. KBW01]RQO79163.1 hypothetical protein DBR40_05440 [Pedobacter sp. KBW01]